jgi:two-component system KDP operon response regulator KdpE
MKAAEILVIDDEAQIRKLLEITLQTNDYGVKLADSAKSGLAEAKNSNPDLILLDLGLPDESGQNVLKKLREWYTKPILILSVQSSEEEIVKALDHGANDYLIKPFRTGELLARIRTSLRGFAPHIVISPISNGELEIDTALRQVKSKGDIIKLTSTEYDLLALLYKNEGRVLTHQNLLKEVWGPGYINQSQYLRVFIAQLRKKIEPDPNHPKYIHTESGLGYRFVFHDNLY